MVAISLGLNVLTYHVIYTDVDVTSYVISHIGILFGCFTFSQPVNQFYLYQFTQSVIICMKADW